MKLKDTTELFLYWNRLRRGCTAPDVVDIDRETGCSLPVHAFILDVDGKKEFPFRLSSARLDALCGADQKGRPFVDLWRAKEASTMAALLLDVVDAGCPVVAEVAASPFGELPADLELLLLPLRHRGRPQARILGLAAYAEAPVWLGRLPMRNLALRQLRIIRDEDIAINGERQIVRPFQPRVAPESRPFEQRGHLRVYRGGRNTKKLSSLLIGS